MVFTNGIGAACAAGAQPSFDVFLVEVTQLIVKLLAAVGTMWIALMELIHHVRPPKSDIAHG